MKQAVHFGAGNIGRGFLGQLYSQSGWETVYVDVVPEVIERLNRDGGFNIHVVGPGERTLRVENVSAVDGRDPEAVAAAVASADLLSTAVGVGALPHIVPPLARGLERRARAGAPVDLVICENLLDAAAWLRERLLAAVRPPARDFVAARVGLVETSVGRMIPVVTPEQRAAEPLGVWVEAFDTLPVSRPAFVTGVPAIRGFRPVETIHAYEERKLFCHNCMHCLASYFGYREGHTYVWEAVADPALRARVRAGGWEAGRALVERHGFSPAEYEAHIEDLLTRFGNRALGDTIARVGGDPLRKLGRRDRLVGAALAALEHGITPETIADGVVAGLAFDPPGDPGAARLQALLAAGGVERVLQEVCGLAPEEPLHGLIRRRAEAAGLPG